VPFLTIADLPPREPRPGSVGRYFHSDHMTFASYEIAPGADVHPHSHPHEEVWNVLEGEPSVIDLASVLTFARFGGLLRAPYAGAALAIVGAPSLRQAAQGRNKQRPVEPAARGLSAQSRRRSDDRASAVIGRSCRSSLPPPTKQERGHRRQREWRVKRARSEERALVATRVRS
jgi:hypothetical protein